MWAIRRASNQFRNKGLPSRSGRILCGKTESAKCSSETCNAASITSQETIINGLLSCKRFYGKSSGFPREIRTFSSQVGAKSNGEDVDDGFSELEISESKIEEADSGDEIDDDLLEEEDDADDALNESGTDGKKKSSTTRASSAMSTAILSAPAVPVSKVMDKWVEEGNKVTKSDAALVMGLLRKRRLFVKALQLLEWLEKNNHFELNEATCASHVDLIAKVQGLYKAEIYIKNLPDTLKTEHVYRTLLANSVSVSNVRKAEEIFNKMKDLKFAKSSFTYNQMLLLYKRSDRKKIGDVILQMEKNDIEPSVFTYQILVDVKGQSNDIPGMEQVVEEMEAQGLKPNSQIKTSMARYYAISGLKDKAESLLKELEGDDLTTNRWTCRLLIPIYASLKKTEEVERIWKFCEESSPRIPECLAAIEAWGRLKKIEKAEGAFDNLVKKVKKPSSRHYTALLKVYADHKMLNEGKELVNKMAADGCSLGPLTWDALVKLYVAAGEVEKADSILAKVIKNNKGKPLFNSYITIMEKYAERGDIDNSEKLFQMMREGGYLARIRQYQALLNAYVKAKKPAYGFRDRMKADSISPSRSMMAQLATMEAARKSPMSDLLE